MMSPHARRRLQQHRARAHQALNGFGEEPAPKDAELAMQTFLRLIDAAKEIKTLAPQLAQAYAAAKKLGKLEPLRAAAFQEWIVRAQIVIRDLGRMVSEVPQLRAELEKRGINIADLERGLAPAQPLQGLGNPLLIAIGEGLIWATRVGSVAWEGFLMFMSTPAAESAMAAAIWAGAALFAADSLNLFGNDVDQERGARKDAVELCKDLNPQATTVEACAGTLAAVIQKASAPDYGRLLPWFGLAAAGGALFVLLKVRRPDGRA